MLLVVGGVGALVLVYCAALLRARGRGPRPVRRLLIAFAGSMLGLVVADDLLLLYVFWELTTVFSYLLIGTTRTARRAAGRPCRR